MDLCRRALTPGEKRPRPEETSPSKTSLPTPLEKEFKRQMLSSLCNVPLDRLNEDAEASDILAIGSSRVASSAEDDPFQHDLLRRIKLGNMDRDPSAHLTVAKKVLRKVPSAPIRILDAPDIVDDYYLNLISWSPDNILAVALAQSVYLWNASTGDIQHLMSVEQQNNYVTSVKWCNTPGQSQYIAVGTNSHQVELWDGHALRKIRTLPGHTNRVSSLAWNAHCLTSGGRDANILNHDVRNANALVSTYVGHEQEVCGLQWNEDATTLASGGNENFLCLWDAAMSGSLGQHGPRSTMKQHKAAVKALDWCPFQRGLLASGGGTADRTIKFWNSASGALLNSIDTGSQVCSVLWSRDQLELCSSHGYSENQLILWKYPSMTKIKELTGHTARVLNMEMSPDGQQVVSASADETLRFWNVFGSKEVRQEKIIMGSLMNLGPTIR